MRCISLVLAMFMLSGCAVNIQTFRDSSEPLHEYVLEGDGEGKVLIVSVRGVIATSPRSGMLSSSPGAVQHVAEQLAKARKDPAIKALIIQVDSPGGGVVASEILYDELKRFKTEQEVPAVTLMMNVAASGGYMASVAGDVLVAHPSTVTGSVGTIFISPDVSELMDKVGIRANVVKSGRNKDIGSPFRPGTQKDAELFQAMIDDMNGRFLQLVQTRRNLSGAAMEVVSDARVFTAEQAVDVGLIDRIGFFPDAVNEAKRLAGLDESAQVVVYRRTEYAEDTVHNTVSNRAPGTASSLMPGVARLLAAPVTGFHHLWMPDMKN